MLHLIAYLCSAELANCNSIPLPSCQHLFVSGSTNFTLSRGFDAIFIPFTKQRSGNNRQTQVFISLSCYNNENSSNRLISSKKDKTRLELLFFRMAVVNFSL